MITVFTPSFNREELLKRCYNSLVNQTSKDFLWLIVDDGSTDHTQEQVKIWQEENKIAITYIKQANSGKHAAHNTGVLNCQTAFFICLDSDDFLKEDAIEKLSQYENQLLEEKHLAGAAFLKGDEKGDLMGSTMPEGIKRASINALYEKWHFKGELALLFKTEVLRQYLFPVFQGEKFVGESVIYDQISDHYEMLLLNEVFYLCEYRLDGYTQDVTKLYRNNPKGYLFYLDQCIERTRGTPYEKKTIGHYLAGCWRIHYKGWFKRSPYKKQLLFAIPRGVFYFLKTHLKTLYFSHQIKQRQKIKVL